MRGFAFFVFVLFDTWSIFYIIARSHLYVKFSPGILDLYLDFIKFTIKKYFYIHKLLENILKSFLVVEILNFKLINFKLEFKHVQFSFPITPVSFKDSIDVILNSTD